MTWEIAVVKTTDYGTRLKVGGGTSAYKSLDFVGNATNHLMDNTCVCCGAVIPEGRMVCWACENGKGVSPERSANGTVGTADCRTAGGSGADKQRIVGAGI